ncbi:MAG: cyclic nucleotide-binding domain-containing protein [Haliscomenobacteraceae bacterium CHB4]|nr:cyclic nucleotide-binding domain-containing protein [Haliscomenobacteraceae bacterium CHB4]
MDYKKKNRVTGLLRLNEECLGLSDNDLDAFIPISRFITYKSGQIIFSESQPAHSFFILGKGHVRMNFSRLEPVDLNPGQIFGDWAIINDTVRLATAVAKSNATVLEINAVRFFDHNWVLPAPVTHTHEKRLLTFTEKQTLDSVVRQYPSHPYSWRRPRATHCGVSKFAGAGNGPCPCPQPARLALSRVSLAGGDGASTRATRICFCRKNPKKP